MIVLEWQFLRVLKKQIKNSNDDDFFSIGWMCCFVMLENIPSGNFLKLFVLIGIVYWHLDGAALWLLLHTGSSF